MEKQKVSPHPRRLRILSKKERVATYQMAAVLEEPDIRRFCNKIKPHLTGDDLVNAELIEMGLIDLIRVFEKIGKRSIAVAC
jgi:hypothetical protein